VNSIWAPVIAIPACFDAIDFFAHWHASRLHQATGDLMRCAQVCGTNLISHAIIVS
jgi:hypothetical protein